MNNDMPELKAGDLIKDAAGWCLMIDSKNGYALNKDVSLDVSCILKAAPDKIYRAPEGELLTRTTLMELVTEGREVPKYLYWERPAVRELTVEQIEEQLGGQRTMSQYRITKTLNKVYEVYVEAENQEAAERKGAEMLDNGEGDLVEVCDADDAKVEEIVPYKASQRLIVTLRRYTEAADVEEAYEHAKPEFAELRNRIRLISDVADIKSGEVIIEKEEKYTDFCDDEEKMRDFYNLTRDQFLASYSYLTPEEYDLTLAKAVCALELKKG